MKTYNTDQKAGETIEHWYSRLAKVADQRLVRLEGYQHDTNYKEATRWAYQRAIKDIKYWSGENATRFNTAMPKRKESILAKISDMRTFIESPSSTKEGIKSIYKQRADKINAEYGLNLKWADVGRFFESETFKNNADIFGSKTLLKTIGIIQKNKKSIIKQIEKQAENVKSLEEENPFNKEDLKNATIHINGETAYNNVMVNKLLKLNDLNMDDLFG